MSAESVLRLEQVVAGYRGVPAVHGIDVHVGPGEIVGLLGPNGAGKTTSLLAAMGVLPLLGGTVVLGSEALTSRTHRRAAAGMAFVPEDRGVFRDLTVAENLRLRERRGGPSTKDALEWFPELRRLMGRRVRLLSGGEQQMLAMSGAMLSSSRLLMIDEMSHGLAPIIVQRLATFLREVAAAGTAVLIVEQQVETVLDLADRLYVLNRGRIVLSGTAEELRADRATLEASYLGRARTA